METSTETDAQLAARELAAYRLTIDLFDQVAAIHLEMGSAATWTAEYQILKARASALMAQGRQANEDHEAIVSQIRARRESKSSC